MRRHSNHGVPAAQQFDGAHQEGELAVLRARHLIEEELDRLDVQLKGEGKIE